MIISPKQFIAKLIENKVINEAQGERIEIDALNKNLPIYEYLLKDSAIKR